MNVKLTHLQRLNLFVLLGKQPAIVGELRAAWALQDKLFLNDHEAKAIELVKGDTITWNPAKTIDPVAYDFSESEAKLIRKALSSTTHQPANRVWLEPLITHFMES